MCYEINYNNKIELSSSEELGFLISVYSVIAFTMTLMGTIVLFTSYPTDWYNGQCYVVNYEIYHPGNSINGFYRGKWCVNYISIGDNPLLQNTNVSIGNDNPAEPFCIEIDKTSIYREDIDNILDKYLINTSYPCKLHKCQTTICDDANKDDILVADDIFWRSDWNIFTANRNNYLLYGLILLLLGPTLFALLWLMFHCNYKYLEREIQQKKKMKSKKAIYPL